MHLFEYGLKAIRINFIFPVGGHRVFGRIKKDIRKHEEIIFPDEYHEIFRKHGTLKRFEIHFLLYFLLVSFYFSKFLCTLFITFSLNNKIINFRIFFFQTFDDFGSNRKICFWKKY